MANYIATELWNLSAFCLRGLIDLDGALERIQIAPWMTHSTDDQLFAAIEELEGGWRRLVHRNGMEPEHLLCIGAFLSQICICRRAQLGSFPKFSDDTEARIIEWIRRTACASLTSGEQHLLCGRYSEAIALFQQSEKIARILPDLGELRLREVLWARYGRWFTSLQMQNPEYSRRCLRTVEDLLRIPEHELESRTYLNELHSCFQEHAAFLGDGPQTHSSGGELDRQKSVSASIAEPPTMRSEVESYFGALVRLSSLVMQGDLLIEVGEAMIKDLAADVSLQVLEAACDLVQQMRHIDVRGPVAARLHVAACRTGDSKSYRQVLSAALARVALMLSEDDLEDQSRARDYLVEAYQLIMDRGDEPTYVDIVNICTNAAVCSRRLDDSQATLLWASRAVNHLGENPDPSPKVGLAYGVRAEAHSLLGNWSRALDDELLALNCFLKWNDFENAAHALVHINHLSQKTFRLDEAAAALEETMRLAAHSAQIDELISSALDLCTIATSMNRIERTVALLASLEGTMEDLAKQRNDHKFRKLFCIFLVQKGTTYRILFERGRIFGTNFQQKNYAAALECFAEAESVASDLNHSELMVNVHLGRATLFGYAGSYVAAISECMKIDEHDPPHKDLVWRDLWLGWIWSKQGQFGEAIRIISERLPSADSMSGRQKADFLILIAEALEEMGKIEKAFVSYQEVVSTDSDFRQQQSDASQLVIGGGMARAIDHLICLSASSSSPKFDPERALYWAEYAKSRHLAEVLGRSSMMQGTADGVSPQLYRQEQELISNLTYGEGAKDDLRAMIEARTLRTDLQDTWRVIEEEDPEYVHLRRGSVLPWTAIQQLCLH